MRPDNIQEPVDLLESVVEIRIYADAVEKTPAADAGCFQFSVKLSMTRGPEERKACPFLGLTRRPQIDPDPF